MKRLATPAGCLLLALSTALPAQRRRVDAIFPASSYAVARFGGLDRCKEVAESLRVFALCRTKLAASGLDPAALGHDQVDRALRRLGRGLRRVGLDAKSLRTLLGGEAAVGIGRPTVFMGLSPSVVLAVDIRGREQDVEQILDRVEQRLAPRAAGVALEWTGERFLGEEVRHVEAIRYGAMVSYATAGGYLLVGTGSGYLEDCIRTMKGRGRSIRANPAYQHGADLQAGDPLFSVFVNARPLARMFAPFLPYEAPALCHALGCDRVDGFYWSSVAGPRGSRDVVFAGLPGDDGGLLKGLFRKPASYRAAQLCPSDTIGFATLAVDPEAVVAAAKRFVRLLPGLVQRQAERALHEDLPREARNALHGLGLDPAVLTKFVSLLGREVSVAMTLDHGSPNAVAFVALRDEAKARETLVELCESVLDGRGAPRLRYRKSKGIWFVSERSLPVQPAFAFRDGMLLVSPWLKNLEAVLAHADRGGPMLAAEPSFRKAVAECGPAAFFLSLRIRPILDQTWARVRSVATALLKKQGPAGLDAQALVPTADEIAAAFGDVIASGSADETGFTWRQDHPYGLANLVALGGWGADWVLGRAAAQGASR